MVGVFVKFCSGILEQSMGARNRVGIGLSHRPARRHTGGIDSLEWIPGLLKSLKIPLLNLQSLVDVCCKCRICFSHAEDEMEECDLHDWHHEPPLLCQIENQATIPTRFRVKKYKFLFGRITY